jgi:hypothetical protein
MRKHLAGLILGLAACGSLSQAQATVSPMPSTPPIASPDSPAASYSPYIHFVRMNLCQLSCERAHDRCVSRSEGGTARDRARAAARCWGLYIGCLPNCIDRRLDRDVYR